MESTPGRRGEVKKPGKRRASSGGEARREQASALRARLDRARPLAQRRCRIERGEPGEGRGVLWAGQTPHDGRSGRGTLTAVADALAYTPSAVSQQFVAS
jgi:hypothetical protein